MSKPPDPQHGSGSPAFRCADIATRGSITQAGGAEPPGQVHRRRRRRVHLAEFVARWVTDAKEGR